MKKGLKKSVMHFLMLGMLVLLLAGAGKITAKAESAKQESTTAESAETESAKPVAVVQDDAGLLTDTEEKSLQEQMQEISNTYGCEMAVVTVDSYSESTIEAFADNISDQNDFGYGKAGGGILLALSMGDRKWAISTYGLAIADFTDEGQKYITDRVVPMLSEGDYNGAFTKYASLCGTFLKQAQTGKPYDVGHMPKKPVTPLMIALCIVFGSAVAALPIWVMVSGMKTIRFADSAEAYEDKNSLQMSVKEDRFLRHLITRTPIPKDNGSSGGSSTHTSSSGTSHGGSSGSF